VTDVPAQSKGSLRRGWPFLTRELVGQQAAQREELRLVNDGNLRQVATGLSTPIQVTDPVDRALIEWDLRKTALEFRDEMGLAEVLDRLAVRTRAEVMHTFYSSVHQSSDGYVEAVAHECGVAARTVAGRTDVQILDDQLLTALFKYVALLLLPDEVAGDYRDPRVAGPD